MSLDLYLYIDGIWTNRSVNKEIYIREGGRNRAISREEWDRRFPDRPPVVLRHEASETNEVFSYNITHNLQKMASEVKLSNGRTLWQYLWYPDEIGIITAKGVMSALNEGLTKLEFAPDYFKTFNPENGWGDYDGLVEFVREYSMACETYPDARISVSR